MNESDSKADRLAESDTWYLSADSDKPELQKKNTGKKRSQDCKKLSGIGKKIEGEKKVENQKKGKKTVKKSENGAGTSSGSNTCCANRQNISSKISNPDNGYLGDTESDTN